MSEQEDQDIEIIPDAEQEKKEPTKLDRFMKKLQAYTTEPEAKQHIAEIAKDLECAKSLGYKAIRKLKEDGQYRKQGEISTEGAEPTFQMGEGKPEPFEETETPTDETLPPETPTELEQPPEQKPQQGFREEDLTWMIDRAFGGLAKVTGYGDFALNKEDSEKLGAIWTPIFNQYLPTWMPYAPIAIAAVTTVAIVVPKVKGYWEFRKKREGEKVPNKKKEKETLKEPPEQTKLIEPPTTPSETKAPNLPTTAPFLKKL